ncbi:MAG: hypothetical protein ACLR2E_11315 [Lachnospiraceae bacterium]
MLYALPNTDGAKAKIKEFEEELKIGFRYFQTELFVACGYAICDANTLRNIPEGSYAEIFQTVARRIAEKKQHRYSAEDIIWLNNRKINDYTRECKVCKKIGNVDEEGGMPVMQRNRKIFCKCVIQ